jgi:lauroyl/myristoyl acyltransferase
VECLGRRIILRRGPFMLARVTGAPLIPIVAQWEPDGHICVRAARPLDCRSSASGTAASSDGELCRRAAQWLGEYLVTEPDQIWLWTLRNFLEAPLAPGPAGRQTPT